MDKILYLFGKKLRTIRKKRGLTLEKLSELANITPNHLKKIESARTSPSFKSMVNLANALDIKIKDLFNFDDLQNTNYIKDEFNKIINYSCKEHLQLLYKIHNDIIN